MNLLKDITGINFLKLNGLVPVVVQDDKTNLVLMVGFMNKEAVQKSVETGLVTFFSRTRNSLWTKGEESGNFLKIRSILTDCDNDTLLIKAEPVGPVCHTGTDTCFDEINSAGGMEFLTYLQNLVENRKKEMPDGSYTTSLFRDGTSRIAQKVGEEAIETIIGAMSGNQQNFINEASDLLYHLIVLLSEKGCRIEDVVRELKRRHH
jgi:phosphoribosyl-ATP pyrophosphohydrolase/phosphoribosyl-AMP cyclohydrolase